MALTLIGILVGMIGVGMLSARFAAASVSVPTGGDHSIPMLLCICGAAVAVQYATRRVWLSRFLLIGLLLVMTAGTLIPSDGRAVDRAYAARQDTPLQIAVRDQGANPVVTDLTVDAKLIQINLPVNISGVADGSMLMPDNVRVSIDAPNGVHWSSPWQAVRDYHYLPGSQESNLVFNIDRSIYKQVKSAAVELHLTLALTEAKAIEMRRMPMPRTDFVVPGFGVCSPETGWTTLAPKFTGISCRSAFRQPDPTYIDVLWSNGPCSDTKTEPNNGAQAGLHGAAWVGDFDSAPAQFGITSVWSPVVMLSNSTRETGVPDRPQEPRFLCPGTPLTFTRYSLVKRLQRDFTLPNIRLFAYTSDRS